MSTLSQELTVDEEMDRHYEKLSAIIPTAREWEKIKKLRKEKRRQLDAELQIAQLAAVLDQTLDRRCKWVSNIAILPRVVTILVRKGYDIVSEEHLPNGAVVYWIEAKAIQDC